MLFAIDKNIIDLKEVIYITHTTYCNDNWLLEIKFKNVEETMIIKNISHYEYSEIKFHILRSQFDSDARDNYDASKADYEAYKARNRY